METTTLLQRVIPILIQSCKIERSRIGIDLATRQTGQKRGDIWISTGSVEVRQQFESGILCLIEAKTPKAHPISDEEVYSAPQDADYSLRDAFAACLEEDLENYVAGRPFTSKHRSDEWFNALVQGKAKAAMQGLAFFGVTNCQAIHFYHTETLSPIRVAREEVETLVRFWPRWDLLQELASGITTTDLTLRIERVDTAVDNPSEFEFIEFLERIHNRGVFRFNDENVRINTLLTFVFFKFLDERVRAGDEQTHARVVLWSDFLADLTVLQRGGRVIDADQRGLHIATKLQQQLAYLRSDDGVYPQEYKQFAGILDFPSELDDERNYATIDEIYKEFSRYHFHGCAFDVYGAIYETFTSENTKKELGQFYTRRHISRLLARLVLRPFSGFATGTSICDPACGTGGLLTECFSYLWDRVSSSRPSGQLTGNEERKLREEMFEGFDISEESVAKAKLNMFFAGDSGGRISKQDSVVALPSVVNEDEHGYDVVVANPPMGRGQEYYKQYITWGGRRRDDLVFLERMVKALNYGGRMGFVVPDGFLENPSLASYRKRFLEQVKIESIISLPRFAFAPYTKNKTSLVIGNRRDFHTVLRVAEDQSYAVVADAAVGIEALQRGTEADRESGFASLDDQIWLYIVDFDGYANSDWRFPTNLHIVEESGLLRFLHNDIENDLIGDGGDQYLGGRIEAWDQIDTNGQPLGQAVEVDGVQRTRLVKADFVDLNGKVSAANGWNLLPEFHLRPYESKRTHETLDEVRGLTKKVLDEAECAVRHARESVESIASDSNDLMELNEYGFDDLFEPPVKGTSGLTQLAVYESILQGPPYLPKWGGQARHDVEDERVSKHGRNNKGRPIRTFLGGCLILSLDGSAGCMTYKPMQCDGESTEFVLNHHAAVLRPKDTNLVNLRYFRFRYEPYLKFLAVSQASKTLTLGLLRSQVFELPDITIQRNIANHLEIVWGFQRDLNLLSTQIQQAGEGQVGL